MKPYIQTDISVKDSLKFDVKSLQHHTPDFARTEIYMPGSGGVWYIDALHLFNTDWLNNLNSMLPYNVTGAYIFWRSSSYQHPNAHIDSLPKDHHLGEPRLTPVSTSFNWVLDHDPTAYMIWYKPWWNADDLIEGERAAQGLIPHPKFNDTTVQSGTMYYHETPVELLEELDRHSLSSQQLTVIRTDIPHNVQQGSRDRWCLSLRVYPNNFSSWRDTVNSFGRQDFR